jgi:hypothetical protein
MAKMHEFRWFYFINFFIVVCWVGYIAVFVKVLTIVSNIPYLNSAPPLLYIAVFAKVLTIVSNISYLNSAPPLLSFILPFPPFLEQFQRVSFLHLFTYAFIICAPALPLGRTFSTLFFSNFVEEKT